jgi:hypothetical protein
MSGVAAASVARIPGDESDLARALHRILAALTDVRGDTSSGELGDRIPVEQWLRVELTAVETLLTATFGRRTAADATPEAGQNG